MNLPIILQRHLWEVTIRDTLTRAVKAFGELDLRDIPLLVTAYLAVERQAPQALVFSGVLAP